MHALKEHSALSRLTGDDVGHVSQLPPGITIRYFGLSLSVKARFGMAPSSWTLAHPMCLFALTATSIHFQHSEQEQQVHSCLLTAYF